MNYDNLDTEWHEEINAPAEKAIDLDNLKIQWEEEDDIPIYVPQGINHLKKAQHPLYKLKQNMKREIYLQVLCLLIVAFVILRHEEDPILHVVSLFTCILITLVSVFYLTKLYRFYKTVQLYTIDTKDSLLELYYNLKLNMERYKSFIFLAMSFFIMHQGITLYSKVGLMAASGQLLDNTFSMASIRSIIPLIVCLFLVIVTTNWWVNFFYGRYADQVKEVLDELKET